MLPRFPELKPIELSDRPPVEAITRRFKPISDYNFGSLWCWDVAGTCRIGTLNGNLVVRFKDYQTDIAFYSFLGDNLVVETARELIARSRNEGLSPRLGLISESVIAAGSWPESEFAIVADPPNFDYVLSVKEWTALPGNRYAAHRARANKAARKHCLTNRPLDLHCRTTQRSMLRLFDRWAEIRAGTVGERQRERTALERLFLPGAANGVSGCAVYEGATMCGFTVWEGTPGGAYSNHHFMKTDWTVPGLSSLLIHLRSHSLFVAGYEFANIEQDLGIPGLGAYKRSLQPCHFLHKYLISSVE